MKKRTAAHGTDAPETDSTHRLYRALLTLETEEDSRALLADLLTPKELTELSSRLEVARLLKEGDAYADIAAATGASTATISRVSKCLTGAAGGYRAVLARAERAEGEKKESSASLFLDLSGLDEPTVAALRLLVRRLRGE